ncbi:histidine kinase [Micromonospora sp. NPDC002296]|uniref:sensor histidine kinase n=1 Tax=Micromonospora sp. NPDC002296 TaxID=3154271 RepID=UPI00332B693F
MRDCWGDGLDDEEEENRPGWGGKVRRRLGFLGLSSLLAMAAVVAVGVPVVRAPALLFEGTVAGVLLYRGLGALRGYAGRRAAGAAPGGMATDPSAQVESSRRELAIGRTDGREIGRELHDLLGLGLSTITLKTELASQYVGRDDERVRRELGEVLVIARHTIDDVRRMARGDQRLSLVDDITFVRELLTSLGVRVTARISGVLGDDRIERELSLVLREAVTNLQRHSHARRCCIRLRRTSGWVRMSVSNDGVDPNAPLGSGGSGLPSLQLRLSGLGGTLVTLSGDGWFHIIVNCPLPSAATPRPARSEQHPADYAH